MKYCSWQCFSRQLQIQHECMHPAIRSELSEMCKFLRTAQCLIAHKFCTVQIGEQGVSNFSCRRLNKRAIIRIYRTGQLTGHSEETHRSMFLSRSIKAARVLCGLPLQYWNRQFEPHSGHKYMFLRLSVLQSWVISGLLAKWYTAHGVVPNVHTPIEWEALSHSDL